jgi:uncharacterized membrane protein
VGAGFPPPVAAGYGAQPYSPTTAVSYGFEGFKRNAGPFVLLALAIFLLNVLVNALRPEGVFGSLAWNLISLAVSVFIGIAMARAGLAVVDGRRVEVSDLVRTQDFVAYLVAWILVSIIVAVGFVLLIIPGIIAAFLLSLTSYAVLDAHQDPITALKSSFATTSKNVGPLIVLFLVLLLINLLGGLLCGIGLLVSVPTSVVAVAYTWRHLTGGPVAPI